MSAVDTAAPAALAGPRAARRPNPRFLASELRLIFGRRRNQAGLAMLAAVPIVLALAVRLSNGEAGEAGGPEFVALITGNGFFVALAALGVEIGLFLPIAVAAISVDAIAGEANVGTLRYLLAVPVARTRMLAVKYAAVVIFAFAATAVVAVTGLVVGLALFGGGPVTLLSGSQVGLGEAMARLAGVCGYLAVCLSALGAIGLFVSTLTEQPIGGGIAVVMAAVASFILDSIPQIAWLHPYLPTHWWLTFGDLLRDPVAWDGIRSGLLSAGAYILIFTLAAWARFSGRDVTS
jgi:ABC-2 type transport system permease protein